MSEKAQIVIHYMALIYQMERVLAEGKILVCAEEYMLTEEFKNRLLTKRKDLLSKALDVIRKMYAEVRGE